MRVAILVASLVALSAVSVNAETYVVNPDGSGEFPTIQAAIDATEPGDVVELLDGVFSGDGNRDIDFEGKEITLRSQSGDPTSCIIDCQADQTDPHRGLYLHSFPGPDTLVEGITIRNGYDPNMGSGVFVFQTHATLRDCVFLENRGAGFLGGAGVAVLNGSASIEGCRFAQNHAYSEIPISGHGGGLYCEGSTVTVTGCEFVGNLANSTFDSGGTGAGLASVMSELTVDNTLFRENGIGESNMGIGRGAGLFCSGGSASLAHCLFWDNLSEGGAGGAVATYGECELAVTNCTFALNGAREGAIHLHGGVVTIETSIITGTYFSGLTKDFAHCYPVEVWAGEITLTSCDVFGNDDGDWIDAIAGQEYLRGNFSAPPCFCDPDAGDFALCADSSCAPENHPWGWGVLVGAFGVGCEACDCPGPVGVTDPPEDEADATLLPRATNLLGAVPNPFNPHTSLRFELAVPQAIRIGIWDLRGHPTIILAEGSYPAGEHSVLWNGRDAAGRSLPSGTYLVRLETESGVEARKVMLLR